MNASLVEQSLFLNNNHEVAGSLPGTSTLENVRNRSDTKRDPWEQMDS